MCIDLFTAVKAYSFAFIESRTSTFVLKTISSTDLKNYLKNYSKSFVGVLNIVGVKLLNYAF